MRAVPLSPDIAIALASLYHGGAGSTHSSIGHAITSAGYAADDPFDETTRQPSKETRLRAVLAAAQRRPDCAKTLVDGLLRSLRNDGYFESPAPDQAAQVRRLHQAFGREGWHLDDDGRLSPYGAIDLETGGRAALDEQIARLRRATDDPGQLLGSANDLLEAIPKFVLQELGLDVPSNADFGHLWYLARNRLGVLPEQVAGDTEAAKHVKAVLGNSWKIAEQIHFLRGKEGTGHGRTLPTSVTAELALLMVREACSVGMFVLDALDRAIGVQQ